MTRPETNLSRLLEAKSLHAVLANVVHQALLEKMEQTAVTELPEHLEISDHQEMRLFSLQACCLHQEPNAPALLPQAQMDPLDPKDPMEAPVMMEPLEQMLNNPKLEILDPLDLKAHPDPKETKEPMEPLEKSNPVIKAPQVPQASQANQEPPEVPDPRERMARLAITESQENQAHQDQPANQANPEVLEVREMQENQEPLEAATTAHQLVWPQDIKRENQSQELRLLFVVITLNFIILPSNYNS